MLYFSVYRVTMLNKENEESSKALRCMNIKVDWEVMRNGYFVKKDVAVSNILLTKFK